MAALLCVLDAPVTLVVIAVLIRLLQVQLAGTAAPRIVAGGDRHCCPSAISYRRSVDSTLRCCSC